MGKFLLWLVNEQAAYMDEPSQLGKLIADTYSLLTSVNQQGSWMWLYHHRGSREVNREGGMKWSYEKQCC